MRELEALSQSTSYPVRESNMRKESAKSFAKNSRVDKDIFPKFCGKWKTYTLGELETINAISMFRGNVISQNDIGFIPGPYPIYSSSVQLNGLFGKYGKFMFDEELITWSIDGGGDFFYRPKHRFSVTNVCGCMRVLSNNISCRYLAYQLQLLHSCKVFDYTMKAHPSVIRDEYVVTLPSFSEQHAIAEVLSDVDRFLDALEKLIIKKQAIKQAAMQQLLIGNTRLPGFNAKWEKKRIRDLLVYERPDRYIIKNPHHTGREAIPVLTANKSFILGYTDENFGICYNLPAIIFDDFTTDIKYVNFPFKIKSSAIKLLRAKNDMINLAYVFYRMQMIQFHIGEHKRYYISEYQNLEIPFPGHDEQKEIISVLSDMDAEITTLERRHDKTRAVKKGMMQQLLTGKTRLIKTDAGS